MNIIFSKYNKTLTQFHPQKNKRVFRFIYRLNKKTDNLPTKIESESHKRTQKNEQ